MYVDNVISEFSPTVVAENDVSDGPGNYLDPERQKPLWDYNTLISNG